MFVFVGHFKIVTKNTIKANLKGGYACSFNFFLLHLQQQFFGVANDVSEFIQLAVVPCLDGISLAQQGRSIGINGACDQVYRTGTGIHLLTQSHHGSQLRCQQTFTDRLGKFQGLAQLQHLSRIDLFHAHLRNDALQIAYLFDVTVDLQRQGFVVEKISYHVVAGADATYIQQRHQDPLAQHPGSHGGGCVVQHIQQRATRIVNTLYQLQVANGKTVQPHKLIRGQSLDGIDVSCIFILSSAEVVKNGSCSNLSQGIFFNAKSFEVLYLKSLEQSFPGKVVTKDPVFERIGVISASKQFFGIGGIATGIDNFRGLKAIHEFGQSLGVRFCKHKFSGRDVDKGQTVVVGIGIVDTSQVVIGLAIQHRVGNGKSGSDHIGDAAVYYFFFFRWFFQLLADGYPIASPHQLGQVHIQRVKGKACQWHIRASVVARGKYNAQNLSSYFGIIAKGFIKIANTVKQDGIRMFGL